MSYLALCAAPYDNNGIEQQSNTDKKRSGKTKTLKKAIKESFESKSDDKSKNTNIQENENINRIKNIHDKIENDTSNSNDNNYQPLTHESTSSKLDEYEENTDTIHNNYNSNNIIGDKPINLEQFTSIDGAQRNDYYKQHVPYYTQMSEQPISSKDELLTKLDKILYLLQEQKDQQTGHVTEELILYSFLGVFIIFITDSFARAGKYMR